MLVDALLEANHRSPDRIAVDDGRQSLTYRRLVLLAGVLRDMVSGATPCERIGIMLPASSVFPATLFGVLWSSKIAIPLNFLQNAEEIARVVADAELDLIVTIHHFKNLTSKLPARMMYLEDLPLKRKMITASLRRTPSPPKVDAIRTAVILYTSGTTAEPKGVELSQQNIHSNAVDAIHSLNIETDNVFLNVLPPFHVFGLTINVVVPTVLGATTHAIPRFSPVATVKTVEEKGVSIMVAIPSMYAAILRTKSAHADAFRSIRLAVSGGEPLSESVRSGFQERFGVTLCEGYGLTETSPVVAADSPATYRKGTVGRPIRGARVRIVAADGSDVAAGEVGEILVSGPGVMKGYYKKPDETRLVIDDDGWFRTGDIGTLDAEGYLSITGRAKEMLIIGGENVFPREIEAVLEEHESVQQAAVIGMPDDLRGELPAAFVIPHPGMEASEQALRNHAKNSLAGFKVPKRVIVSEDLPKGPTGKILKRRLRELL